jgi:hypothetical protein
VLFQKDAKASGDVNVDAEVVLTSKQNNRRSALSIEQSPVLSSASAVRYQVENIHDITPSANNTSQKRS